MNNPRGYGTGRASVEKADSALYSQEPASDYWQALWRVVAHLDTTGEHYDTGPLPFVATLVADIFWVHPERVRSDLIKFRRAL